MTFTTLTYNGVEKPLADWGIGQATREVTNQSHDHFACDVVMAADSADPIPYGGQIILRIGRTAASGSGVSAAGLPLSGITSFTDGQVWFVGWRVETFRSGSPALEQLAWKFAGPWEFFFERLVFQKLWWTYNGTANVADWRSQVVLGLSANALVGAGDTIPGTSATNLMSIAQQVKEIAAYVIAQTTTDYGAPQFQFDALTADSSGNYNLYAAPGPACLIPDYIAGVYAVAGKTSATANLETVLRAPLDSVNDITCAEAMRKMLRWIGPMGDAVVWFDYTTSPPTLHISTRDQLPAISLPMAGQLGAPRSGGGGNAGFKIKRRDDLIPTAIALKYRITGTWAGAAYVQVIHDIAGTIGGTEYEGIGLLGVLVNMNTMFGGSPTYVGGALNSTVMQELQSAGRDFDSVSATIDMEGPNSVVQTCTFYTIPVNLASPAGGGTALAFWQTVFPELADMTGADFYSGSTVSVLDDSGAPIDTGTFSYLLTRNQVAAWMLTGNTSGGAPCQSINAHITAEFVGMENNKGVPTGHVQHQPKHATVTLVTLPGAPAVPVYSTIQLTGAGEIIPYGLAGYIYNIGKIPQYEGTFTLQETEVTDPCPMGNNLNITGGLAEWAAMNAMVNQISYDLATGRTTLAFGPAAHLGAKDFVERLRVNRGPRWYNLNGGNMTNTAGGKNLAQLGSDVAKADPAKGPDLHDQKVFAANLADLIAHGAAYTAGMPGITIDNRPAVSGTPQQPNYGAITGLSAPTLPTFFLASGSGGTLGHVLRVSLSDVGSTANAKQIFLQEYPVYWDFGDGNGCVAAWVLLLGSKPYKTSIHG